jgi:hypothetical protein
LFGAGGVAAMPASLDVAASCFCPVIPMLDDALQYLISFRLDGISPGDKGQPR